MPRVTRRPAAAADVFEIWDHLAEDGGVGDAHGCSVGIDRKKLDPARGWDGGEAPTFRNN